MRIDIQQSTEDDQWYVRYEGDNGEAFAASEGYPDDGNALQSVRDFMASVSKQGHIVNGMLVLNINVTVTDRDGNISLDGGVMSAVQATD